MEFEDLVVEVARRGRRFGDPVEVTDVLAGFPDDPRIVVTGRPLVTGHDGRRVQGLDGVKGREPVEPALVIGLGQVEVHVVVDGVAGDDKADLRDMQAACRVGVGMPELHRDELVTFEVDDVAGKRIGQHDAVGDLAGQPGVPDGREILRG
jgi:hypothetical protein